MEARAATSRRRPLACEPCRKRKLRCDRTFPCGMCLRSRREECSYAPGSGPAGLKAAETRRAEPPAPQHASDGDHMHTALEASIVPEPVPLSVAAASPPIQGVVSEAHSSPEHESSSTLATGTWHSTSLGSVYITAQNKVSPEEVSSSAWGNSTTVAIRPNRPSPSQSHSKYNNISDKESSSDEWIISLANVTNPVKGIMFKGRYLGPSHWLHSMLLIPKVLLWHHDIFRLGNPVLKIVQEAKHLSRQLKAQRRPKANDVECGHHFPPRMVCDQLLEIYVDKFESIQRIVHIPTLMAEYERHWTAPQATDKHTLLKIQLCLALGCYLYDDTFTLRAKVEQWVHEAKTALVTLGKAPSTFLGIQLLCLLYYAQRYLKGKWGSPVWISGGTVYHAGIALGLHIDPSKLPGLTHYEVEMRRRIWMCILEIQVETSLDAGTPPVLSQDEHDCFAPSNLDDNDLDPTSDRAPSGRPLETYTSTSLQILSGQSLPLRLKIAKVVNSSSKQATYGEILRLTSDLEATHRNVMRRIASYGSSVQTFHKRRYELLIRRCFLVLHLPYMSVSLRNPFYNFSRKVCVENAIRLSYARVPSRGADPTLVALSSAANFDAPSDDFARFSACTAGATRTVRFQCDSILAGELFALVEEEGIRSPGGTSANVASGNLQIAQLQALIRQSFNFAEMRLRANFANFMDYGTTAILYADVESATSIPMPAADARERRGANAIEYALSVMKQQVTEDLPPMEYSTEEYFGGQEMDLINGFWLGDMQGVSWSDLGYGQYPK